MYENLLERFIAYAKVDTRSDDSSYTVPSTHNQVTFALELAKELIRIGLEEVEYNETNGFLTATLPSNTAEAVPVIGFIAHPERKHGKIRLAFGPDEELGARGAKLFDVDRFAADFAYTIDGGPIGNLTYDNFNAAQAELTIRGTSVHPGSAKDTMVNALLVASQFATALPQEETPERTSGYEGYYLLTSQSGTIDEVKQTYYIRDHDRESFAARKRFFTEQVAAFNSQFVEPRISLTLFDQYYNMRDIIEQHPIVIDLAVQAYESCGITPVFKPMRGGTDGCIISHKGLPTPNLFSGTENGHGKYEFVTLETMAKSVDVIMAIVEQSAVLSKTFQLEASSP